MTLDNAIKQQTEEHAKRLRKLLRSLTQSALSVRVSGRHHDWIDIRGTNDGKLFTHHEKLVIAALTERLGLRACWSGYATIPPRLTEQAIIEAQAMVKEAGVECD